MWNTAAYFEIHDKLSWNNPMNTTAHKAHISLNFAERTGACTYVSKTPGSSHTRHMWDPIHEDGSVAWNPFTTKISIGLRLLTTCTELLRFVRARQHEEYLHAYLPPSKFNLSPLFVHCIYFHFWHAHRACKFETYMSILKIYMPWTFGKPSLHSLSIGIFWWADSFFPLYRKVQRENIVQELVKVEKRYSSDMY